MFSSCLNRLVVENMNGSGDGGEQAFQEGIGRGWKRGVVEVEGEGAEQ